MIFNSDFDFAFNPNACSNCGGACCIGESGYIWVTMQEIENIAKYLNITVEDFAQNYLIRAKNRYSLKEFKVKELGYACIFFDVNKRLCKIYDVRPKQCRTFPFWQQFKDDIQPLLKECPGVVVKSKLLGEFE